MKTRLQERSIVLAVFIDLLPIYSCVSFKLVSLLIYGGLSELIILDNTAFTKSCRDVSEPQGVGSKASVHSDSLMCSVLLVVKVTTTLTRAWPGGVPSHKKLIADQEVKHEIQFSLM